MNIDGAIDTDKPLEVLPLMNQLILLEIWNYEKGSLKDSIMLFIEKLQVATHKLHLLPMEIGLLATIVSLIGSMSIEICEERNKSLTTNQFSMCIHV